MSVLPCVFIQKNNILYETINGANMCHSSNPIPEGGWGNRQ